MYGLLVEFLRQKYPAPGKRLAQSGLSKDYLHASDVRSMVRRSLAIVGQDAGNQAGEGDARAVSFKASWPGGGWVQQRWEHQGKGPVWKVS